MRLFNYIFSVASCSVCLIVNLVVRLFEIKIGEIVN